MLRGVSLGFSVSFFAVRPFTGRLRGDRSLHLRLRIFLGPLRRRLVDSLLLGRVLRRCCGLRFVGSRRGGCSHGVVVVRKHG